MQDRTRSRSHLPSILAGRRAVLGWRDRRKEIRWIFRMFERSIQVTSARCIPLREHPHP